MTSAQVTVVMLDGEKHDVVGVYMPLGDRIEFERKYGRSIFEKAERTVEADGSGTATLDTGAISEEDRAFFVWKMLQRAELPVGSVFEEWSVGLEQIIGPKFLTGPVDPTVEDQQPGLSQS